MFVSGYFNDTDYKIAGIAKGFRHDLSKLLKMALSRNLSQDAGCHCLCACLKASAL